MTDQNLTEIVCVIDRSGSMGAIRADAIGGFNTFLEDQKKESGRALLTLAQFDDVYEIVHNGKPISDVPPLTDDTYVPRGCTALLDAIGRTVTAVGERLANTPEEQRPGKVIVCILTDGMENASKEYTNVKINEMITTQRDAFSWEFVFLAANQDAFATAQALGISYSQTYSSTSVGTRAVMDNMSCNVSNYRRTGKVTGGAP